MKKWFIDSYTPFAAYEALIAFKREQARGLLHDPDYAAEMEKLEAQLRQLHEDAQIVSKVDVARGRFMDEAVEA